MMNRTFNLGFAVTAVMSAMLAVNPVAAHPRPVAATTTSCILPVHGATAVAQPSTSGPAPSIDAAGGSPAELQPAPAPAAAMVGALPAAPSVDYALALELAQLSESAYCKPGNRKNGCIGSDKKPIPPIPSGWSVAWESKEISFVATKALDDGTRLAALVYRGTDSWKDTKLGLYAARDPWLPTLSMATGTGGGFQTVPGYSFDVTTQQRDKLVELCPLDGTCTRIITGHSKGGATAHIAAYILCAEANPAGPQCETADQAPFVYTFGAPTGVNRVGLSPYTARLTGKWFDFVNGDDCVPYGWRPYPQDRGVGTPVFVGSQDRIINAAKAGGCAFFRKSHSIKRYIESIRANIPESEDLFN